MKRTFTLIAIALLLAAWTHGNGAIIDLLDNSDVILTTGTGDNLIE